MTQADERDPGEREADRSAIIEAKIGALAMWAIFGFMLMMFI